MAHVPLRKNRDNSLHSTAHPYGDRFFRRDTDRDGVHHSAIETHSSFLNLSDSLRPRSDQTRLPKQLFSFDHETRLTQSDK